MRIRGCGLALALLAVSACGDDGPRPLVMLSAERRLAPGAREFTLRGSGCASISRDASGGTFSASSAGVAGSAAPPGGEMAPHLDETTVERAEIPSGVRVTVLSGAQLLASKLYTIEFLESEKVDLIDVVTPGGTRFQLANRGAHSCDEPIDLFAEAGAAP